MGVYKGDRAKEALNSDHLRADSGLAEWQKTLTKILIFCVDIYYINF